MTDLHYPSPIIDLNISYQNRSAQLKIPRDESFLVKEIFEEEEYGLPSKRSHDGPMQVWDVGANVGLYAIYMKLKHPHCVIHCYEPAANTLALCRNNTASFADISIYPYGLFNQDQDAMLHHSALNTVSNSIKITTNSTHTTPVQLKDAGAEFDRLGLSRLDVLKVDAEGCEVEILASLGPRLATIDYVVVEYHTHADRLHIDQLLTEFRLFSFRLINLNLGVMKFVNARLVENK